MRLARRRNPLDICMHACIASDMVSDKVQSRLPESEVGEASNLAEMLLRLGCKVMRSW